MPVVNVSALIEERVSAIRTYHEGAGVKRAELDVSGGVDSAVMLGLLAKALGPDNVTAAYLGINSNTASLARASEVAMVFGIRLAVLDLTEIYGQIVDVAGDALGDAGYSVAEIKARCDHDPTIFGSIRSTLRAPVGRALNRLTGGGIRHGTGNEDEDRVLRFYQKGGDGEVDTNPIAMLSKGEVFQIAIGLGVPHSILSARPSPDLWGVGDQHNDEEEIAAYLGVKDCGHSMYSYVDLDTGAYKCVGLIERLHRFLDDSSVKGHPIFGYETLFEERDADAETRIEWGLQAPQFVDVGKGVVRTLLTSARRVERATRHKMNPNCPALGSRREMIKQGILTDALPVGVVGR